MNFLAENASSRSGGLSLSASDIEQLKSELGTKKPWKLGFPAMRDKRPDALLQILGGPDFVRQDGESQIWQYRSSDCILDMFIQGPRKNLRIIHSEIRGRSAGGLPSDSCVTNLIISKVRQKHAFLVREVKHRRSAKSS